MRVLNVMSVSGTTDCKGCNAGSDKKGQTG